MSGPRDLSRPDKYKRKTTIDGAASVKSTEFQFGDLLRRHAARATLSFVVLCLIAAVIAPRTLAIESLASMTPFIGVLGVAAIGQHLVIQQRGFDLSVAGGMSLAAVIVTVLPTENAGGIETLLIVALALAVGAAAGLLNGMAINFVRIPSLVMTIGTNALLVGCVLSLSRGAIHSASTPLVLAANARLGAISVLFLVFVVVALLAAWGIDRTTVGRRFVASAVSPPTARAIGIHVGRYNILTYCVAGILFALAGVMLAGLAVTPTLLSGGPYMLTTFAAIIVGGSPLNGDRGSVIATTIGVVFLVFLDQLVVSLGFDYAIQSIVEAGIILAGVTVPELLRYARFPAKAKTLEIRHVEAAGRALHPSDPILELVAIRKTFGSTVALAGVDLSVTAGEVHAIIGENGAGKSTLISIAAGVIAATEGQVKIAGRIVRHSDPNTMRAAGVSVAFQHPPLPPHLTVIECLCLANRTFGEAGAGERASSLIDRIAPDSLRVRPQDRISDLSIGQRHVVEIARALASDPKVFVLDEPTEPFKDDEVAHLFALIRMLKAQGVAIIYISHRLGEVEEIADRISVLRDGALIETRDRAAFSRADIIRMIVGRPLGQIFPDKRAETPDASVALRVRKVSGSRFHDMTFEVARGEIIGVAGVEGQGQREFMRALAGLEDYSGDIEIAGRTLTSGDRTAARRSGIAFVPDDRHREGLFLSLSVEENLGAGGFGASSTGFVIDRDRERRSVAKAIGDLSIKTASSKSAVASLSGGNQQKVLISREMAAMPRVFLADEPTKGVDIGSKSDIYQNIRRLADDGVAVIVASSDGVELEGLCDRVLVMARGTVACELSGSHVSDAEITAANLTADQGLAERRPGRTGAGFLRHMANGKWLPSIVLSLASLAIFYAATSVNGRFLSSYNLDNVQAQLATLALIAFGQLFVMLLGEIDFSVGPLAGLVVVLASYWIPDGTSTAGILGASVGIILVTAAIGFLQGLMIVGLNLPSIVVTLATFFALQGLSLSLRPSPGGTISGDFVDLILTAMGPISAVTIVIVMAALVLERVLFRSMFGRKLRALGRIGRRHGSWVRGTGSSRRSPSRSRERWSVSRAWSSPRRSGSGRARRGSTSR